MPKKPHILIERMEAFEDHLSVNLSGLSAEYWKSCSYVDYGQLRVCGQVNAKNDGIITSDIRIYADALDSSGRVIQVAHQLIQARNFRMFRTFEINVDYDASRPARVRVYPKPA